VASEPFYLTAWDAGIQRKPANAGQYLSGADRAATRRMEVLEWIIIVVITISITISLLPSFPVIQR
jgi:hypothetical protein